jgi:hypothetical protein
MLAATIEIPECLWAAVCPNCGYALDGLPRTGTCPECGRQYGKSEVVLHGFARGAHESPQNAKRSRLAWVIFCSVAWILFQLPQLIFGRMSLGWLAYYATCALLPLTLLLMRRVDTQHPGLVQLRLTEKGCAQLDDLTGPSELRKKFISNVWIIVLLVALVLVIAFARHGIDPVAFWIWFGISILVAPFAWRSGRRFRRAARTIPEGAVADAWAVLQVPVPWNQVTGFRVAAVSGAAHRVTIYTNCMRITRWSSTPVDAEISCSQEVADQLSALIGQWVRGARQN